MRKKTVNHLADTIFWYLLYFLPIIAYLLFLLAEPSSSTNVVNFATFFDNIGMGFVSDNILVNSLSSIFGANGVLPIFANNTPFLIFAWFIGIYLVHLVVDFLLFIPRLCHKYMKNFTQGD